MSSFSADPMVEDSRTPASPDAAVAAARPARRSPWRALAWAALAAYFAGALVLVAVRHVVLPNIDAYRSQIERLLGDALGLRVAIRAIDASWQGLNPRLKLQGFAVFDAAGRPALSFEEVTTVVSWTSLPAMELRLDRLELDAPALALRREQDGSLYVAGMRVDPASEGGGLSEWLLAQRHIVVRDAQLTWSDARRGAPPLELRRVNLHLANSGSRHRFGLTAEPPPQLAARLDVRGDFRGQRLDRLEEWRGEAYAAVEFADLAAWRSWVDYPVELPRGYGALRAWVEVRERRLAEATVDVAARDVELRAGSELPVLALASLAGRLSGSLAENGISLAAQRLQLATRDGIRIAPTDVSLDWQAGDKPAGRLTAGVLDLDAIVRLASHLPLDAIHRQRLAGHAPRGRLLDLDASWQGPPSAPRTYSMRSRFDDLAMQPYAGLPGFEGMDGTLRSDERGGELHLATRDAVLVMPAVFPEPRLLLDRLTAEASWNVAAGGFELSLKSFAFDNRDAAGSAYGRYRGKAGEPGEIDLSARLTRGKTDAVWRYLPHVVVPEVRDWLKHAIVGGSSDDTRLRLKGDLTHFPFQDSRLGIFQVSARFSGATLRFAPGWPEMAEVAGDLLFEGSRMRVRAQRGGFFGIAATGVLAEIPDLGAVDPLLKASGRLSGPTADFLRFVAESPVAERIGHFTDAMRAEGNAAGELTLELPLAQLADFRVRGELALAGNTLVLDPELPPLTAAAGHVRFTESKLAIREGTGVLFGSPLSISAETQPDGVRVTAQGNSSMASLRQQFDAPLFDHLSGSAPWRAELTLQRDDALLVVESNLVGVSSSLPEPLNKNGAQALPLRIERKVMQEVAMMGRGAAPPRRELLRVSLGRALQASVARRQDGAGWQIERGMIGLNETPTVAPARGVAVVGELPSLNVDAWRRLLRAGDGAAPPLPVTAVNLRAGELLAFGQSLSDFTMDAALRDEVWQAKVASKELAGELAWRSQGQGRMRAQLRQLVLAEVRPQPLPEAPGEAEDVKELPGLEVTAESFSLAGKALGRLELRAVNRGPAWRIERLTLNNPDGRFDADGEWRAGPGSGVTQLAFKLDAHDAGKLLERLGYGVVVRRGTARLTGKLAWQGVPSAIDYPTLEGNLELEAQKGQFAKLEPGVGRLLGIVSLQALPRRITLDFRDVFSEGFAFDTISGSMAMTRGVIETQNLLIQGPAAKVLMSGAANLPRETQNLKVRVQPALSETVAIGAAVVNPLAGVATYLAQKVLRDPIEQMFAYEYAVSGSWAEPKVEKLARAPAAAAP
jgi:uncharacterized protein (TIGR02099 family)